MIKDWNDMTPAEKWIEIKYQCNLLIGKSDWTQLPDALLSDAEKNQMLAYRDALRNLDTATDPNLFIYPTPPNITTTLQTPEIVQARGNRQQIKTEYLATLTTLEQIESTVNPTNAQVIAAVKFLAKTLKLLLKLIARLL